TLAVSLSLIPRPSRSTLFPYTTLFRSNGAPLLVKTVTEQGESIMGPIHGTTPQPGAPPRQGLYDPAYEHDACGVAFVATLRGTRSEEHTSELQSRENLVCRLLLEKKNK